LAIAGKDVGSEIQTAYRGKGLEKVFHLFCCGARIVPLIHHRLPVLQKLQLCLIGSKTIYIVIDGRGKL
jgi:hypothetical protein